MGVSKCSFHNLSMDLIFLVLDTKSFYEFTIASGGKIALRNFHLGTHLSRDVCGL